MTEQKKDFIPFDELWDMLPEIEARLTLITGDKWEWFGDGAGKHHISCKPFIDIGDINLEYDARFVAHAPTDIRNLLDLIRMLKSQLDSVGGAFWREQNAVVERDRIIAQLSQEIAILENGRAILKGAIDKFVNSKKHR